MRVHQNLTRDTLPLPTFSCRLCRTPRDLTDYKGSPIDSLGRLARPGPRRGHLSIEFERARSPRTPEGSPIDRIRTAPSPRTPEGSPIDSSGRLAPPGPRRGHLSIVPNALPPPGPRRGHLSIEFERLPPPGPQRGHLSIVPDGSPRPDPGGVTYR